MMVSGTGISKVELKKMQAQENEWRAREDLNTLIAAAKIRKDPERFKLAMEKKKAMLAELEAIKVEN
jgi:hypothetical protein